MSTKFIVFANQKGGVGKTTLCMAMANYLALESRCTIAVVDSDPQLSLFKKRETEKSNMGKKTDKDKGKETDKEKEKDNDKDKDKFEGFPYQIYNIDFETEESVTNLLEPLKGENNDFVLFDTPGYLNSQSLLRLIINADFIFCPLVFEDKVLASTGDFIMFLQKIRESYRRMTGEELKARLVFIPNNKGKKVGTMDEMVRWKKFAEAAKRFGDFAPEVYHRVNIGRLNTFAFLDDQLDLLRPTLKYLKEIISKNGTTKS